MLANGITAIPLADAYDLAAFFEYIGRAVPRHEWAIESIQAAAAAQNEGLF